MIMNENHPENLFNIDFSNLCRNKYIFYDIEKYLPFAWFVVV